MARSAKYSYRVAFQVTAVGEGSVCNTIDVDLSFKITKGTIPALWEILRRDVMKQFPLMTEDAKFHILAFSEYGDE